MSKYTTIGTRYEKTQQEYVNLARVSPLKRFRLLSGEVVLAYGTKATMDRLQTVMGGVVERCVR